MFTTQNSFFRIKIHFLVLDSAFCRQMAEFRAYAGVRPALKPSVGPVDASAAVALVGTPVAVQDAVAVSVAAPAPSPHCLQR